MRARRSDPQSPLISTAMTTSSGASTLGSSCSSTEMTPSPLNIAACNSVLRYRCVRKTLASPLDISDEIARLLSGCSRYRPEWGSWRS
jgi:hypothetical protein